MAQEQDKAKEASKALGGLSGMAAKFLSGRDKQIDQAVEKSTGGGSPNQNSDKGADGNGRPGQRNRFTE